MRLYLVIAAKLDKRLADQPVTCADSVSLCLPASLTHDDDWLVGLGGLVDQPI